MATMYGNPGEAYHPNNPSVNFDREYYQEERKKYLTARYGQHQMRLIRKRLAVEDWLDKELRKLYNVEEETSTYDCEIDLDELLDVDIESERRSFISAKIANSEKSQDVKTKFIDELLEKAQTL